MPRAADRNLLFGINALQNDFITRDALIAAMNAWALEKHRPLGEILVERGALDPADRDALEAMIARRLAKHGDDPAASLAAISSARELADNLRRDVDDPEVQASIAQIPTDSQADPHATRIPETADYVPAGVRYHKIRDHARGGLGVVFVARDGELNREVALKEIHERLADNPANQARFLLEAEVTGGLEHPGIVPVYGLGHYDDGRPYYAMRFIRGDSLMEAIDRFHADPDLKHDPGAQHLSLQKLIRRFLDVCNAIDYAHSRGVLHRDLKPHNVMVGRFGETLVVDWGLAKVGLSMGAGEGQLPEAALTPASASGSVDQTLPGSVIGTPAYMSPEQAVGRLDLVGVASDVYSLGATLYALLTGRPPFTDKDLGDVLRKVEIGDFPRPREASTWLDPALEAICLKAMALRPADRYASPRALADDIDRWLADEPVAAFPESWRSRGGRWLRRHRAWAQAGAGALFLTAGVAVFAAIRVDEARRAERTERGKAEVLGEDHRKRLVREYIANGTRLLNDQPAKALAWFTDAMELDQGHGDDEAHRIRLSNLIRQFPRLDHVWFHAGEVSWAEFSPDGRLALTTSHDRTARVWNVETGAPETPPLEHEAPVRHGAFSPDGRLVATACEDGTARVWDARTGRSESPALRHDGPIRRVAFRPDGLRLATASGDGTARLWDVRNGTLLRTLTHAPSISSIAWSPDGRLLASTGADGKARLWDAETGRPSSDPMAHPSPVHFVAFGPDGRRMITLCDDNIPRVWDVGTGRPLGGSERGGFGHHSGVTRHAAFSPGGRQVATVSDDGTGMIHDVETGGPYHPFVTPKDRGDRDSKRFRESIHHENTAINFVAYSPDGRCIITAGEDGTIRVWDAMDQTPVGPVLGHAGRVNSVAFCPEARRIMTASADGTAKVWDLANTSGQRASLSFAAEVHQAAFSSDGRLAVVASGKESFPIDHGPPIHGATEWDVSTAKVRDEIRIGQASDIPKRKVSNITTAKMVGSSAGIDASRVEGLPEIEHQAGLRLAAYRPDITGPIKAIIPLPAIRHQEAVRVAAYSPDGRRIVTACDDGTARIWDAETHRPITPPLVHTSPVYHAAFGPDSKLLATASADRTARVWDAETGEPVSGPLAHGGDVLTVQFGPDGHMLLTASEDGAARLWNMANGAEVFPPIRHRGAVGHAVFRPDGRSLATASDDGTARIWDSLTGDPVTPPLEHSGAVRRCAYSPDGQKLATACDDGTVRVWDAATGRPVTSKLIHASPIYDIAFSPDGRLASACQDGQVRIWDAKTGRPLLDGLTTPELDGPRNYYPGASGIGPSHAMRGVAFSPDGRWLATGGDDGAARLWNAETGDPISEPMPHDGRVSSVTFSPDGRRLLTANGAVGEYRLANFSPRVTRELRETGEARLWDLQSGRPVGPPLRHRAAVISAVFSPDDRLVLTSSLDGTARMWSVESGSCLATLRHEGPVSHASFSPDGRRVVTASIDRTARVWDTATGSATCPPLIHPDKVTHAAFSPDGRRVVTSGADSSARVWDTTTGRQVIEPLPHRLQIFHAAFSPDGRLIVTGSADQTARVWDAATGKPISEPMRHGQGIPHVVFSPDGRHVATASSDATARVWDAATGKPITRPLELAGGVRRVAFSPDGRWLVAADAWFSMEVDHTGELRAFDAKTGDPLTPRIVHEKGEVMGAAFSPDGRLILAASQDRTARLWEFAALNGPSRNLIALARLATGSMADARGGELSACDPIKFRDDWRAVLEGREANSHSTHDRISTWHRHLAEISNWSTAAFHLRRLIAIEPSEVSHLRRLRLMLGRLELWDQAVAEDTRIIVAMPRDPIARASRARAHAHLERWEKAVDDYKQAIDLGLRTSPTWHELAMALDQLGRRDEALAAHAQAIRANPNLADNYRERGLTYIRMGRFREAVADFDSSLNAPMGRLYNPYSIYSDRARANYLMGDLKAALADRTRAIESRGTNYLKIDDAPLFRERANLYLESGEPELALADYERGLELDADNWQGHYERGDALASLARWEQAVIEYSRSIELSPRSSEPWIRLALARMAQGRFDDYREVCRKMVDHFEASDDLWAMHRCASICSLLPDAVPEIMRVVRLAERDVASNRDSPSCLISLGGCLHRAGRHAESVETLTKVLALKMTPEDKLNCEMLLALAHAQLGHHREAMSMFHRSSDAIAPPRLAEARPEEDETGSRYVFWSATLESKTLYEEAVSVLFDRGFPRNPFALP